MGEGEAGGEVGGVAGPTSAAGGDSGGVAGPTEAAAVPSTRCKGASSSSSSSASSSIRMLCGASIGLPAAVAVTPASCPASRSAWSCASTAWCSAAARAAYRKVRRGMAVHACHSAEARRTAIAPSSVRRSRRACRHGSLAASARRRVAPLAPSERGGASVTVRRSLAPAAMRCRSLRTAANAVRAACAAGKRCGGAEARASATACAAAANAARSAATVVCKRRKMG